MFSALPQETDIATSDHSFRNFPDTGNWAFGTEELPRHLAKALPTGIRCGMKKTAVRIIESRCEHRIRRWCASRRLLLAHQRMAIGAIAEPVAPFIFSGWTMKANS